MLRSFSISLLVLVSACTPEIQSQPPPTQVVALFDPGAEVPVVPTPNDLALDPRSGLLALPDAPDATEAEQHFNRYLRTLDGFPTSAVAQTRFSAPLDPASVTLSALRVLDVTDPAAVEAVPTRNQLVLCQDRCSLEPDPAACGAACPAKLAVALALSADGRTVTVTAPWERERVYALALVGGPAGLKGAAGEPVVGAPAFMFLRARTSLATCADLSSPDCRAVTSLMANPDPEKERASVIALELARLQLRPGLEFLEKKEALTREQLATAWTFRTVRQGLVTFDPAAGIIPFPNDLLMKDGQVDLPEDPKDDAATRAIKADLEKLDGFSTSASLISETGEEVGAADVRLDGSTLQTSQFRLINLAAPAEEVPFTVSCRSCGAPGKTPGLEPDQVAITPSRPLRSHTRYAVLWLEGVRRLNGGGVNANPTFALARLPVPLLDQQRSTVATLDDAQAALLEPLRQDLQPALAAADALALPREKVLLAFTFTTQTTSAGLPPLAAKPAQWGLPTALSSASLVTVEFTQLSDLVKSFFGVDLASDIRWAKEGEFTSANALDLAATEADLSRAGQPQVSTEGAFTAATLTTPKLEARRFLLVVPKTTTKPGGKIPVVIYQHGLGQSRRDALVIANSIAKAGYATLSIDAPFHGLRSYCRTNSACAAGVTCTNHRCPDTLEDPADGYLIRQVQVLGNDPLGTPEISGTQFTSSGNLMATRDHFRHQVIDLAQLLRVLGDTSTGIGGIDVDDPATTGVVEKLDPVSPRYIGQSLGGIIGTLASAALPELTASTLNVPGASMTDIMIGASGFGANRTALDSYLTSRGKPPGSQAYAAFLDIARWALDPADPQSFGRHLIAEPLVANWPRKRIFISWIKDDQVVPNFTTDLLLRSIETGPAPANLSSKMYVGGDHAFLLNVVQTASLAMTAQAEAMQWVDQ